MPLWLYMACLVAQFVVSMLVMLVLTSEPRPPTVKCYGDNQVWTTSKGSIWIIPAAPECLK